MNDPKRGRRPGEAQGSFFQTLVSLLEVTEDTRCSLATAPDLFFQEVQNKTAQHVNRLGCTC